MFFLLALNIGAVIGSIITAWAGVRFGPLRSAVVAALLAAAGLAYLLTSPWAPPVHTSRMPCAASMSATRPALIASRRIEAAVTAARGRRRRTAPSQVLSGTSAPR